jgi:hypothetical protein
MFRQEKARAAAAGRAARKGYEWRALTLPRAIAGLRGLVGAHKGSSEARTEVLKARADRGELAEAAGAAGQAPPSLVGVQMARIRMGCGGCSKCEERGKERGWWAALQFGTA